MINVSIAGIGGQGSVLAAKILAQAAVRLKLSEWLSAAVM